jgi:hypothetical protein
LGKDFQAFLGLLRAHRFFPSSIPHLCLRLKVCLAGVVGVPVKVIVVQGELRELIQEVYGLP